MNNNYEKKIEDFLSENKLLPSTIEKIGNYCLSLMKGILSKLQQENIKNRYLDIHLRIKPDLVNVILKDDSPRLDSNEESQISSLLLGEGDDKILENKNTDNLENPDYYYFYLNGENIYTMEIKRAVKTWLL